MRVTTGPRRRVVMGVVAAALALNVLLLIVATVGGTATLDDPANTFTPPADATTQDTGVVNPWAAGDAAILRALAELGRAGLNGCPWSAQRQPCALLTGGRPSTRTPARPETIRPHDAGAGSGTWWVTPTRLRVPSLPMSNSPLRHRHRHGPGRHEARWRDRAPRARSATPTR
jgi:hypothetical protein